MMPKQNRTHLIKDAKCSPKTFKDRVKFIRRVFDRGINRQIISENPFLAVNSTVKGESLNRLHITLEELGKLIAYLSPKAGRMREWLRAMLISVQSGARLEDCVTMRKNNVKSGILTYTAKKGDKTICCPLVVEEWNKIILEDNNEHICPLLNKEFESIGNAKLSSEFTAIVNASKVKQEWTEFSNGRKVARKTFHSLRHTLRTFIVSSGGSDAQADLILGHSAGQGKTYTHAEIDSLRSVLENVFDPKD